MLSIETVGNTDGELHGVAERPNYLRDSETKALFIIDDTALAEHEERKNKKKREQEYKDKVDKVENDLDEVKRLLSVLINKVDNK